MPVQINKYKVIRSIGEGGMGAVYLAVHPTLDKEVVIKQLKQTSSNKHIEQFKNEASNIFHFQNEHIINFYDHFEKGGDYYIVLEYVNGRDLSALLEKGPIPITTAIFIAKHILEGLAYAHKQGVIHRDIKPGNILVSEEGEVKIADFGISTSDAAVSKYSNKIVGTPAYMAPELFSSVSNASPLSDIYAFGVLLYMMLSWSRPFPNVVSPANIQKIQKGRYKKLSGLPLWVSYVLNKSLHKHPLKRFQSCEEILKIIQKKNKLKSKEEERKIVREFVQSKINAPPNLFLDETAIEPAIKRVTKKNSKIKATQSSPNVSEQGPISYQLDSDCFRTVIPLHKKIIIALMCCAVFLVFVALAYFSSHQYLKGYVPMLSKADEVCTIKIKIVFPREAAERKEKWFLYYTGFHTPEQKIREDYIAENTAGKPIDASYTFVADKAFATYYNSRVAKSFQKEGWDNSRFSPNSFIEQFGYQIAFNKRELLKVIASFPPFGKKALFLGPFFSKKYIDSLYDNRFILNKTFHGLAGRYTFLFGYGDELRTITAWFDGDQSGAYEGNYDIGISFENKNSSEVTPLSKKFVFVDQELSKNSQGQTIKKVKILEDSFFTRVYNSSLSESTLSESFQARPSSLYYLEFIGNSSATQARYQNVRAIPLPGKFLQSGAINYIYLRKKSK